MAIFVTAVGVAIFVAFLVFGCWFAGRVADDELAYLQEIDADDMQPRP